MARAVKLMAKADALEKECEQKDRYIAELIAKEECIKCELGINRRYTTCIVNGEEIEEEAVA